DIGDDIRPHFDIAKMSDSIAGHWNSFRSTVQTAINGAREAASSNFARMATTPAWVIRKAHPSAFGAIKPAAGIRMLAAAHNRLPNMTRVEAQRGTAENCELTAMKVAIGIRLAPAQNRSP